MNVKELMVKEKASLLPSYQSRLDLGGGFWVAKTQ
jgi:hypothetical protein